MNIQPLTREQFVQAAAALGINTAFKDARCHGEWKNFQHTGILYIDSPYDRLMIARGLGVEQEGGPPEKTSAPTLAATGSIHREMTDFTGVAASGPDCHWCGLDPRTCDCR